MATESSSSSSSSSSCFSPSLSSPKEMASLSQDWANIPPKSNPTSNPNPNPTTTTTATETAAAAAFNAPSISIPTPTYQPPPSPQLNPTLLPTLDLASITLVGKEESRNWSLNSKWSTASIISLMGFIAPLGSSIVVPGAGLMDREFHLGSRVLSLLPVSLFVLGLGVGPFVLAPISELKGRQPVYIISSIIFVLFNIGSAVSNNEASLYILRFLAGVAGSSGPSLGAGSIGDMFAPNERGRAQSLYGLGPLMGPVIGNVIGGYVVQKLHSWRWLLWILTILSGAITIVIMVFLRETYSPAKLQAKRKKALKEHNKQLEALRRAGALDPSSPLPKPTLRSRLQALNPSLEARDKIKKALSRPFRLLFTNPICAIFSIYMGFCYGIIFLFLTQHPLLFQRRDSPDDPPLRLPTYGWSVGTAGLTYLGLGAGFLVSMLINVLVQDAIYARLVASNGKVGRFLFKTPEEIELLFAQSKLEKLDAEQSIESKAQPNEKSTPNPIAPPTAAPKKKGRPEYRLPLCLLGMLILPMGLFVFGWTAQNRTHWSLPLLGSFLTGLATILCFQTILVYLVDAFIPYSASATACAVLVRSILAAAFPLFATQLYESLGFGWGSSLLAFVSMLGIPVPIVLYIYGEGLRNKYKFHG